MVRNNDNSAVVWNSANPRPMPLISSYNDGMGLRHISDSEASQDQRKDDGMEVKMEDDGFRFSMPQPSSSFGSHNHGLRSGLAERKAKAGFSAPTLDTTRNRLGNMDDTSLDIRSPYVTIPPGLSPTTLLESPVFLSNTMAQTSPTTGKLQFGLFNNANPLEDVTESFAFKPPLESRSSFFSVTENKASISIEHSRSPPCGEVSTQSEQPGVDLKNQQIRLHTGLSEFGARRESTKDSTFSQQMSDSFVGNDHFSPPEEQQDGDCQQKVEFSSLTVGAPQDDGYNWRKYGQKQVKGSEYPRSYYKCTHTNCQVKKKVERSHEGHITEIIYKGNHSHPMPPPSRRSGTSHPYGDVPFDGSEQHGSQASFDGQSSWNNTQEWRNDGPDANMSSSGPREYVDSSAPMAVHDGSRFEPTDVVDVSTTMSNDEDDDDRATHGSVSQGGEGEGDESESKRRKLDATAMEMSAASRAGREPRVVVQTTSEVDILDDGYRWRKYGQKVVKGNPNPRSYYKCTNPGCTVRKHVERASHDLKSVITTYEGKHIHDVPAARNSGHSVSGSASSVVPSASQSHLLHRRPDPVQLQDSLMRFDNPAHVGAFGLTGREQLGPPTGLSFGMGQQGLANLPIPGFGPMAPLKMPGHPPFHPYMGDHRPPIGSGFLVPKGELKEESVSETSLPTTSGYSSYHQAMGRFSLGPQL